MTSTNNTNTSKGVKITYWIITIILSLFFLSGAFFMNSDFAIEATHKLGAPEWLRWELNIGHIIGGLLLILPVGNRLKEWNYVAIGIDYISAFIANTATYGIGPYALQGLLFFVLLIVSYICYHKMHKVFA